MYTIIGLLRLGWITQYLSQPVISGFMSGACITIAMSQVLQQTWQELAHCQTHVAVPRVLEKLSCRPERSSLGIIPSHTAVFIGRVALPHRQHINWQQPNRPPLTAPLCCVRAGEVLDGPEGAAL